MKIVKTFLLATLRCFCAESYELSIGGLVEHEIGEDDIVQYIYLQHVSIGKALNPIPWSMKSPYTYTKNINNSVLTILDYNSVKAIFYSDLSGDYSSIGRFRYRLVNPLESMQPYYEEFFVSLNEEKRNSFSLIANSSEVLKFLIGKTIVNCVKGLRRELVERLGSVNMRRIYEFTPEGFSSTTSLLNKCKSFFENNEFEYNNPKDAYEKFMHFYLSSILGRQVEDNFNILTHEHYVEAFAHARDFSNVCECARTENKGIYNNLRSYKYRYSSEINVYKALFITFSFRFNLQYYEGQVRVFGINDHEITNEDIIDMFKNCISIRFDSLAEYQIQYLRFFFNGEEMRIDVSRFTELASRVN